MGGVGSVTDIYQSNITGGSDNILTLNVNGAGTADAHVHILLDIDDTGLCRRFRVDKVRCWKTNPCRYLKLVSDADSVLNIHDGTLTLATDSERLILSNI